MFTSIILLLNIFRALAQGPEKGALIFHDDFDGDSIDMSKWHYVMGDGSDKPCGWGWGNGVRLNFVFVVKV